MNKKKLLSIILTAMLLFNVLVYNSASALSDTKNGVDNAKSAPTNSIAIPAMVNRRIDRSFLRTE